MANAASVTLDGEETGMRSRSLFLLAAVLLTAIQVGRANAQAQLGPFIEMSPSGSQTPPAAGNHADDLVRAQASLGDLQKQQAILLAQAQGDAKQKPGDDNLKKQVEILQKQIAIQQEQIQLLMKQVKAGPAAGSEVEKLQTQVITLDARSKQAAQRDVELAGAIDKLTEERDADQRYGPKLPATLKELFLPTHTNETPLSIYGALAFGYSKFIGNTTTAANGAGRPPTPGGFYFGEFTPDFLLKMNDWMFLEAEIAVGADGSMSVGSFAQADFFINDWLTIIAGRMVAPIGFYNERLNNPWINKLPGDAPGSGPPLWSQVLPPFSLLGVQATGAFYLGCSPFKMEYHAYVSNGFNLAPATAGAPTINELANFQNMQNTFNITTNEKLFGGRLGIWWPEKGLAAGVSALSSGDYLTGGFENMINLWAIDLSYHKGNWDFRFEYGTTYQQTSNFLGTNIRRQGLYGQVAYRPRDHSNRFLQNLEFVYRYSFVEFNGIDPATLDLTTFSTPLDVPVRRQQHEFGVNYWFAPRIVIKFAYQINDEPGFHLHDNQFLTELAWGW